VKAGKSFSKTGNFYLFWHCPCPSFSRHLRLPHWDDPLRPRRIGDAGESTDPFSASLDFPDCGATVGCPLCVTLKTRRVRSDPVLGAAHYWIFSDVKAAKDCDIPSL
jgi:hypothetical protein